MEFSEFARAFVPLLLLVPSAGDARTRLYVGGLLPFSPNPYAFSVDLEHAVRLAVDHINDDQHLLPDHELVLTLNDSRCNAGLALYQMNRLLTASNETKLALLGEACSHVTQPLAATSHFWNIPQFNFLSGSMKLESRTVYPRYYHILPTADGLNRARAYLLKSVGWRKSIILVQAGELFTLNAKDLRDQVILAGGLESPDLQLLPESNKYDELAQYVKDSNVRVIFGLFYEERARQVICSFYRNNIRAPTYVWILVDWYHSQNWYTANNKAINCSKAEMKEALDGHFTLDFTQLRSDTSAHILTGKSVSDVTLEFQNRANISSKFPISEIFKQYSAYGYDAILALARMFDKAVHRFTATGEIHRINHFTYEDGYVADVFNEILENDTFPFEGLTGRVALYNLLTPNEKRKLGQVQIDYIQTNVLEAHETDGQQVTIVGLFQNQNGEFISGVGVGVDNIPWTTEDGKVSVDSPRIVVKLEGTGTFIAIAFIDSVCIVLALVLLFFNIAYRNHSVMRKSFSHLNELILFGGLLVYTMVIVYGFDGQFFEFTNSSLALCYLRDLLLSFGVTFVFGSLLVKTTTTLLKRSIGANISVDSLLVVNGSLTFGFMLLIDAALFSVWYGFEPWKKGTQKLPSSTSSQTYVREKCTSDDQHHQFWASGIFLYKLIVMIICGIAVCIRVKARGQKERGMSDSPYLDISAVGCSFGFAIASFGFTFVENPSLQYILVSLSLIAMTSIVLVLLFYRKISWIWKSREEIEEKCEEDIDPMRDMAAAELKDLRKRSRELRIALEKVMGESSGISDVLKDEVGYILRNKDPADAKGTGNKLAALHNGSEVDSPM